MGARLDQLDRTFNDTTFRHGFEYQHWQCVEIEEKLKSHIVDAFKFAFLSCLDANGTVHSSAHRYLLFDVNVERKYNGNQCSQ